VPTRRVSNPTFLQHGTERLQSLCGAIELDAASRDTAVELFKRLTSPWGETPIEDEPRWRSDITDDHTPYEFSLAVERHRPELRILVEAQAAEPNVRAQWLSGLRLNEDLERSTDAHFGRFRDILDLFEIEDDAARFGIWHAVNIRAGQKPQFKLYLNPASKGPQRAAEIVGEALDRLGFRGALSSIPIRISSRTRDEIKYFSLDLSDGDEARVKVYLAHDRASAADIEAAVSVATNYIAGEPSEFCRAMSGHDGPYLNMALQSCYSFTTRGGNTPVAATTYFPVRAFAESDEIAKRRILSYMMVEDRSLYERVLRAFARRGLDAGTGMQTYASYRRQNFCRRVTVYLSPEAYAIGPRSLTAPGPVSGVRETASLGDALTSAHPMRVVGRHRR
jgi:DMATS type aromatic prenyltransferase